MKVQDNDFFKELIDNAATNQDINTNFSYLLEEQIIDTLEESPEEFIENLVELILTQLGVETP